MKGGMMMIQLILIFIDRQMMKNQWKNIRQKKEKKDNLESDKSETDKRDQREDQE